MGGIFMRRDTPLEHRVVAGLFAFASQTRARDPHERVEPAHRAQPLDADLHEPVVAPDVRELVAQDRVNAILGPLSCV